MFFLQLQMILKENRYESHSKEIDILKRNQMEIIKMKKKYDDQKELTR